MATECNNPWSMHMHDLTEDDIAYLNAIESDPMADPVKCRIAEQKAISAILRKLALEDFAILEKNFLNQDECCCDYCKEKGCSETFEELRILQSLWLELRQYIRIVYRLSMKGSMKSIDENYHKYMKGVVSRLCEICDPHQLYQRLEGQVREFVVEVKVRLLQLMDRLADNPQLPRLFISGMLDRYHKMMKAAMEITPILYQLEHEHLSKFNLTWIILNQRLFQTSIYTDLFFQNSVPLFITQLGKSNDCEENKILVREFLSFDDEITLVEAVWADVETRLHQYSQEHSTRLSKQKLLKEDWSDYRSLRHNPFKFCNNNQIHAECNGSKDFEKVSFTSEHIIPIEHTCECRACSSDTPTHTIEFLEFINSHKGGFRIYEQIDEEDSSDSSFPEMLTATSSKEVKQLFVDSSKSPPKVKKDSSTSTRIPSSKRVDKATQKDPETFIPDLDNLKNTEMHHHHHHHGPTPKSMKDSATDTGLHHPHCAKHSELIKRIQCPEHDVNNGNNQDDSHSESSQPDPRHCDCCYCEVFGHGLPAAAPMSRNYQEMRERLRLLLTKKKSKCKSSTTSPQSQTSLKKHQNSGGTTNTLVEGDTRALEDLLDFIEGNEVKCKNEKKAAKKARQKEKKRVLLSRQKFEEEEKARRLEEALLQRQREEELAKAVSEKEEKANSRKKGKNKTPQPQKNELSKTEPTPAPQMVTIKRVMEPHNSEPTVTITLRGATPNQDRVLYTLLNGQVCKVKDLPSVVNSKFSKNTKNAQPKPEPKSDCDKNVSKVQSVTPGKKNKQKKENKKPEVPADTKVPSNIKPRVPLDFKKSGQELTNPTAIQINNAINSMSSNSSQPFNIDDIKLPPGITITKVDPASVPSKTLPQDKRTSNKVATNQPVRSTPPSEVIVVATGKLKTPDSPKDVPNNTETPSGKKKKNKKKNEPIPDEPKDINKKALVFPSVDILSVKPKEMETKPIVTIKSTNFGEPKKANVAPLADNGKKKKKKNKKIALNNGINPDELKLLDSVFAPKDDIDDRDMDDAERELEAFKRFCSQSVPPVTKAKVNLKIEDIVLKKKSFITCT